MKASMSLESILNFWKSTDNSSPKRATTLSEEKVKTASKLLEMPNEDNLTDEETVIFYEGTCPDCNGVLYEGPHGGNSINVVCPQKEGGCGMLFMETGFCKPYRMGKRDN